MIPAGNLLTALPEASRAEVVETLLEASDWRLLRIVSAGQATAAGEWYDQDEAEWVLVLAGRAALELEGEDAPRLLGPGDWLLLPAHCRHRVAWTDDAGPTVWLALHHRDAIASSPA